MIGELVRKGFDQVQANRLIGKRLNETVLLW